MDPVVLSAIIAGVLGSTAGGGLLGWALTHKQRNATVELTDAQADQIRQDIYERLVAQLKGEIGRLQSRVSDLEQRLAVLDAALAAKSAELAGTQAERDGLKMQLAAATAEIQAKEREIGDLKAVLAGQRTT
jgi:chromosome segregation ATPase